MTVGRNAPCPCGSGKKYKRCCISKSRKTSLGGWVTLSAVGLMLAAGAIIMFSSFKHLDDEPTGPRKVWSEEHGHWH
jgi:hypothetical protein